MNIPDPNAALGVVTHWLREYSGKRSDFNPDDVGLATEALLADTFRDASYPGDEAASIAMMAFSNGAIFGARAALAIAGSPLGGHDEALRDAVADAVRRIEEHGADASGERSLTTA